MKKILVLAVCLLMSTGTMVAQKYGHINFGALLTSMPEAEAANKQLEDLQKVMADAFQEKVTAFQGDVQKLRQDIPNIAPVDAQKREQALNGRREALAKEEQDLSVELESKRNELLQPLIEKAQKAIADVAKENGFNMIFDTSIFNAVLFAEDSVDVMQLVKEKLGIAEKN